jgi:hypothetical protein
VLPHFRSARPLRYRPLVSSRRPRCLRRWVPVEEQRVAWAAELRGQPPALVRAAREAALQAVAPLLRAERLGRPLQARQEQGHRAQGPRARGPRAQEPLGPAEVGALGPRPIHWPLGPAAPRAIPRIAASLLTSRSPFHQSSVEADPALRQDPFRRRVHVNIPKRRRNAPGRRPTLRRLRPRSKGTVRNLTKTSRAVQLARVGPGRL